MNELAKTKARETDAEICALVSQGISTQWRVAQLCIKVQEEWAWEELGFETFGDYLDARKISRSAIYAHMALLQSLPGIPVQELEKMPLVNAKALLNLPEKRRTEESWIKKAQGSTHEMKAAVNKTPGAMPMEDTYLKVTFHTPELRKGVEEAIQLSMQKLKTKDRGWALAAIAVEWIKALEGHQ